MGSVSVLVPVYNNETTLSELFERLYAVLTPITDSFEVIFVNDGSVDDSWKVIRALAEQYPECVGITLSRNFGQHPAINAGLARARGDLTVLMDADLQDRPEELPKLLEQFDADDQLDIVYTKFVLEDGATSRRSSRLFLRLYARVTGLDLPPNLGTYRVFTARVRDALLDYPERGAVYGPLMTQMGYEHKYVVVSRAPAEGRKTSYTFGRRVSLAVSAMISYSSVLHWLVTIVGAVVTAASGIFLALLVVQYALGDRPFVNGQLLLIGITLLTSGVLLMSVGVLTAYTTRIFQEVQARPKYHVARDLGRGLRDEAAE